MKTMHNVVMKRLFATFLFISISLSVILVAAKDKTGIMNQNYNNNKEIVPYAPAFNMDTLLKWSPESDPDAEYARSRVPLKTGRFYGPQVNEKATKGVKIQSCSIFKSGRDAQEQSQFHNYVFTHWQYLDSIAGWGIGDGGNVGILGIPSADQIDAAHRNGVPITGLFGFPWSTSSYGVSEYKKLVTKNADGSYPYFDKLAQLCNYYGFDGYFINQETSGLGSSDAQNLRNAIFYARKKYPNLIFQWYDAMRWDGGGIGGVNGIGSGNSGWLRYQDDLAKEGVAKPYAMDDIFINYGWNNNVDSSLASMESYGRNKYDAIFTFEVQQNGMNTYGLSKLSQLVEKNDGKAKASIGYYCIDSNFGIASSPSEFHKIEHKFWSTSSGDPRVETNKTGGIGNNVPGMARFVYDKSVINEAPFNTFFSTGHGKAFYINGQKMHEREWTNRSVQDVTPTWTWMIDTEGSSKLNAEYDFETAYYGGNSIKYSGNLEQDKAQLLKLYSTRVEANGETSVRFAYKEKNSNDKTTLELLAARGIKEKISEYNWEAYPFEIEKEENGWKIAKATIPAGETITGLGVKVKGSENLANYELNLGQLALLGEVNGLDQVSDVTVPAVKLFSKTNGQLRTRFNEVEGAMYYEVYLVDKDGTRHLLTVNTNNAIFCNYIKHLEADGNFAKIEIVPVDFNGERHEELKGEAEFYWENLEQTNKVDQTTENVCLNNDEHPDNTVVTNVSSENGGEKASNMFDGSHSSNASKWCALASTGWVEIKLKTPKTIRRIRLEHAEAGGESAEMNTKDFEIFYKDASGHWVTTGYKYTLNTKGVTDAILSSPITAQEFKLVINNCGGTPWRAIRVYEWQMFEGGHLPLTPNYDSQQIEVVRKPGGLADITFKNPPIKDAVFNVRKALDFNSPIIATGTTTKGYFGVDDLTLSNVNVGEGETDFYFSMQYPDHEESNIIKYHLLPDDAPDSEALTNDNLEFKQCKKSNHYQRTDDLQFINITFKNLKKGDKIVIKQANPYSRVIIITCIKDNQEITVEGICIKKTQKTVLISRIQEHKKPTGFTNFNVNLS